MSLQELPEAVLEQGLVVAVVGVLDLPAADGRHQVGGAALRLAQPEHEPGDEQRGDAPRRASPMRQLKVADERAAEADADAGAGERITCWIENAFPRCSGG